MIDTAPLTLSNAFTNTSTGTVALEGTAELTVTGAFTNGGALELDIVSGNGGGGLTIGGTLANTGTVQMGSDFLNAGAANTMTLGGLNNQSTGTFDVFGSAAHQAAVNVVAASGTTASNAGTLVMQENASFNTSFGVNLTNSGLLNVDTGQR